MLNNAGTPGSADWYLLRLGQGLSNSYTALQSLQQYASGDHPLPQGNQAMRDTYRAFQRESRSNYCGLVVSAVVERLSVEGFYSGGANPVTDSAAWDLWQANSLDAESVTVHNLAASLGRAYVIVGPPDPTDPETPDVPIITVESPFQVFHEPDPCRPRRVLSALKCYFDSVRNRQLAIVYMPDGIYYYQAVTLGPASSSWEDSSWTADTSEFEDGAAPNPLGIVPVIPFINRRAEQSYGVSEFADVIDIQKRINTTSLQRLVMQAMQAFRQRVIIGLDVEDENGNALKPFDPGADLIWSIPGSPEDVQDIKVTDLEQGDITPLLEAVNVDVGMLGNISKTPPQYLTGQLVNVSGDALVVAESGLVGKVKTRQIDFGESWERVVRLAGKYSAVPVAQDAEIQWSNPELYSLASKASAMVMLQTAGVPFRERMAVYGYSPTQIDRMEAERTADALLESFTSPQSVAPGTSAVTVTETGVVPGSENPDTPGSPASA